VTKLEEQAETRLRLVVTGKEQTPLSWETKRNESEDQERVDFTDTVLFVLCKDTLGTRLMGRVLEEGGTAVKEIARAKSWC
jgi:hypothetical protein|tara:strand:+ start:25794 stop:26036 length:243 start_codon:yes stop_codon:yes gene_type:complete